MHVEIGNPIKYKTLFIHKLSFIKYNTVLSFQISVWDVRENKPVAILQGHSEMVTGLKFMPMETAPTSQILVSVGDTTCRFWCPFAAKNSKELCSVRQHELDYEVFCHV